MSDRFITRHNGPRKADVTEMLKTVGANSIEELINQTIPADIRLKNDLNIDEPMSEFEYSAHINELGKKNKVFKSYIGLGYYNTIIPPVIQRNILENPGWYTAYTPYQAEISQGRLEALLNFQTMVSDLTGMGLANASLLDESTAAAEAMIMFYNTRSRTDQKEGINKFFVASDCFPQTIDVLKTRSIPLGIELVIDAVENINFDEKYFGLLLQYPNVNGNVISHKSLVNKAHENNCKVAVAADLLSLALLTPPGEWGADVVVGNTQRFGVPLGYGGPHAAYFATKEDFKRHIPGRIIGVSVDKQGNPALRMALQTREQHIRRDKATSNICTAQALLAIMAGMYATYHGPDGIKAITTEIHQKANALSKALTDSGFKQKNDNFFDTICIETEKAVSIAESGISAEINFRVEGDLITISIDQTTTNNDLNSILKVFGVNTSIGTISDSSIDNTVTRTSDYLTHSVFNSYHSETEMMRYIKRLENKDISLTHSMISLGSCTMKLNAAAELYPITNPNFANIHPFVPKDQAQGYLEVIQTTVEWLSEITGFDSVSMQPNSGAQGEYAGLLVIKAYHEHNGDRNRNIALIPQSAHGTNPASAVMAGMKVVVVKCDEQGNINVTDLHEKAEKYSNELSCLLVTYPSTHGVFEESIIEITDIIHKNGGQVYMDGANMNAQVGLTNPGNIGADVCHLNLHKTFAIPHGGGGPGMGPIGVAKHLTPFLPKHTLIETGGKYGISAVSGAPYGSALIILISYGYMRMLGTGLKGVTSMAILNANYMKERLKNYYDILYTGPNERVAHEMILDCRNFKKTTKVEV
ncbi:MAG: aminomethyl-transferring glycine dehydrogenase, partial [Flavobacteriales bacterium]|nr:aminomethyl-transferring glycine dehydrogenase [Flavobacteriales bacterium]